jgi:diguanylate cyclase (GGDEF)-like protein
MSGQAIDAGIYPVLRKSAIFSSLSGLELDAVVSFLEPRSMKKGEVVFSEGAVGEEMFVIVSGRIGAWVAQADGTQRWSFELKTGDFFGEMSIIVNETRSATIVVQEDTELLTLHGVDFYRIVFDYPMIGTKILNSIRRVQNQWFEQISKHLGDIMRWGETARRRAVSDELTGLYNRRFLEESAGDRFSQGTLGLRNVSLMMMDLDKIHEINDNHGTRAGDLVFISTAEVLRSATRAGDICARLSGDEFAVLLPDASPEEAVSIAENARENIASRKIPVPIKPDSTGETQISVCTSIGIATAPIHATNWENLLLAADNALRQAKTMGRNRVVLAG